MTVKINLEVERMDNNKIGEFISNRRKENGLTQKDIAEKIGVTNKAVSKWETGEGYPDITSLPIISEALGVTVDELLKGELAEVEVTQDSKSKGEFLQVLKEVTTRFQINTLLSSVLSLVAVVVLILGLIINITVTIRMIGVGILVISSIIWIMEYNRLIIKINNQNFIIDVLDDIKKIITSRKNIQIWSWSLYISFFILMFLSLYNPGANVIIQRIFEIFSDVLFGSVLFYTIYFSITVPFIRLLLLRVIKRIDKKSILVNWSNNCN